MLILSLDSAGLGCGACVWRDGVVLAEAQERMERGQDQRLMPLVVEVMKKAEVAFNQLDRVAVTRGPGSFTGLRIGLAAAQGIGLAAGKAVLGIDRFSIFREQIKAPGKPLLVVINSRRKELFCRFYPAQGAAVTTLMMTPEEIADFLKDKSETIITGDIELPGTHVPAEKETVTCAALAARTDANDPAYLPRPLYLRAPDVTIGKTAGIEPVTPAHVAILTEIHAAGFGEAAWNLAQMQGSLALATTRGWVAQDGGEAVGFILCQIMPDRSEILTFAVHPKAQRRGFGEKLAHEAIKAAHAAGNAALFLEVAADNRAARALYDKLGFRVSGTRKDYYRRGETAVDAVFYERSFAGQ